MNKQEFIDTKCIFGLTKELLLKEAKAKGWAPEDLISFGHPIVFNTHKKYKDELISLFGGV